MGLPENGGIPEKTMCFSKSHFWCTNCWKESTISSAYGWQSIQTKVDSAKLEKNMNQKNHNPCGQLRSLYHDFVKKELLHDQLSMTINDCYIVYPSLCPNVFLKGPTD